MFKRAPDTLLGFLALVPVALPRGAGEKPAAKILSSLNRPASGQWLLWHLYDPCTGELLFEPIGETEQAVWVDPSKP